MIIRLQVFGVGTNLADCTYNNEPGSAMEISIPQEVIRQLNDTMAPVLRIDVFDGDIRMGKDEPS